MSGTGPRGGEESRPDGYRNGQESFFLGCDQFCSQASFLSSHPTYSSLKHASQYLPEILGIVINLLSKSLSQ